MDEIRLKRLENDVTMLNRRVTDHDTLHAESDARHKANAEFMSVIKKTVDSHEKMIALAEKAIELLEQLIKYLSWIGVVAKWVSTVVVAFTAAWHGVKWIMAKVWFLQ